jgi:pilus assembly protein CpaF
MRPDRVVVGEIRGGEALDIVQAMTSGHGGCMGTLHATHPRDTLTRLETMCMMSDIDMPLQAMRQQIGSGVQLVVQVSRLHDGSRKLTHVTEVLGFDLATQRYQLQDIFAREYQGTDANNRIVSTLVPCGVVPSCLAQVREHGVDLPDVLTKGARSGDSPAIARTSA